MSDHDIAAQMKTIRAALGACQYRQCLRLCRESLTTRAAGQVVADTQQRAEIHNLAGLACKRFGRLAEASEHYRQAFVLHARDNYLNNRALVLQEQGRFQEAQAIFRTLLEPTDDTSYSQNFYRVNASGVAIDMGDFQAGAQTLTRAYHNYTTVPGAVDRDDFSFLVHRAGLLLHGLGFFRQAIHLLSDNLMLRRDFYGEVHLRTGEAAARLAQVELDAQNLSDAMDHCAMAENIYRPIVGKENLQLARLAMMQGNILDQRGQGDPAIYYARAEQILVQACGNRPHPDCARLLQFKAEHRSRQRRWDEALALYARAEAIYRSLYQHDRFPYIAELYHNQGHCLYRRGDNRAAWRQFVKSRHILRDLNPNHPWLRTVYQHMANVLVSEGHAGLSLRVLAADEKKTSARTGRPNPKPARKQVKAMRILLVGTPDMQPRLSTLRQRLAERTAAFRAQGLSVGYAFCRTLGTVTREAGRARTHGILVAGLMGSQTVTTNPSRAVLSRAPWIADYRHREDTDRLVLAALPFCDAVWLYCLNNSGDRVTRRFQGDLKRVSPPPSFDVASQPDTKSPENAFIEGLHQQITAWLNGCVHTADRR